MLGLRALAESATLAQAHEKLRSGKVRGATHASRRSEIRFSATLRADAKERIAWQSERIEWRWAEGFRAEPSATIGATAPFVGLFRDGLGVMGFIGIPKAHTTNLAVVAPGIAEALLARSARRRHPRGHDL